MQENLPDNSKTQQDLASIVIIYDARLECSFFLYHWLTKYKCHKHIRYFKSSSSFGFWPPTLLDSIILNAANQKID